MYPCFGQVVVGDVEGAEREILRMMPLIEEFWYFLLVLQGGEGEWQGAQPLPPSSACSAWGWGGTPFSWRPARRPLNGRPTAPLCVPL